jgi:hypothetical protein
LKSKYYQPFFACGVLRRAEFQQRPPKIEPSALPLS